MAELHAWFPRWSTTLKTTTSYLTRAPSLRLSSPYRSSFQFISHFSCFFLSPLPLPLPLSLSPVGALGLSLPCQEVPTAPYHSRESLVRFTPFLRSICPHFVLFLESHVSSTFPSMFIGLGPILPWSCPSPLSRVVPNSVCSFVTPAETGFCLSFIIFCLLMVTYLQRRWESLITFTFKSLIYVPIINDLVKFNIRSGRVGFSSGEITKDGRVQVSLFCFLQHTDALLCVYLILFSLYFRQFQWAVFFLFFFSICLDCILGIICCQPMGLGLIFGSFSSGVHRLLLWWW